jgi:hypothetical protein
MSSDFLICLSKFLIIKKEATSTNVNNNTKCNHNQSLKNESIIFNVASAKFGLFAVLTFACHP